MEETGKKLPRFGPGYINIDFTPSVYSSCAAIEFGSSEEMNQYFMENPGLIVVQLYTRNDFIVAVVSKELSDEEREELTEIQYLVEEERQKRRAARNEEKAKFEEAKVKAAEELREMEALGRKCKDNHGAVMDENARMKKELKKLRREQ